MEKTRDGDGGGALESRGDKSSFWAILTLRCLLGIRVEAVSRPLDIGVGISGISV